MNNHTNPKYVGERLERIAEGGDQDQTIGSPLSELRAATSRCGPILKGGRNGRQAASAGLTTRAAPDDHGVPGRQVTSPRRWASIPRPRPRCTRGQIWKSGKDACAVMSWSAQRLCPETRGVTRYGSQNRQNRAIVAFSKRGMAAGSDVSASQRSLAPTTPRRRRRGRCPRSRRAAFQP